MKYNPIIQKNSEHVKKTSACIDSETRHAVKYVRDKCVLILGGKLLAIANANVTKTTFQSNYTSKEQQCKRYIIFLPINLTTCPSGRRL